MATFMGEIGGELFPTSKIWESQHIFFREKPSSVPVRWGSHLRKSPCVAVVFVMMLTSGTVVHLLILDQNF